MLSFQQIIYQQLPSEIKKEILENPKTHPVYNEVVSRLNADVLKNFKNKINLSSKNVSFIKIMLEVYYHIKLYSPKNISKNDYIMNEDYEGDDMEYLSVESWNDFIEKNNYKIYNKYMDYIEKWPKFMFLLYYTYNIVYYEYYKRYRMIPISFIEKIPTRPKYDKNKDDLLGYIIKIYKFLDKNFTLKQFRDIGF